MPHPDEALSLLVSNAPLVGITPGASPYTYTATDAGTVIVQGGTVTLIELGRKTTFVTTGMTFGAVPVSKGDQVRVTYTVAPTMNFFKR